jgi:phospho-2-dehydro-3-deoxyheptonate aldolase
MVAVEAEIKSSGVQETEQLLTHHWMYDPLTAYELAQSLPAEGQAVVRDLVATVESNPEALARRDENRQAVIDILSGESDKQLIIIGPCSLDLEADYSRLFGYIEDLQGEHPNAVIAWRGNGAKPRSGVGNTGTFNNTTPGSRKRQLDIYEDAYTRGIPILTEITDKDQLSVLAPYLTSAWLGARDMGSTELRKLFSATRLPVFVKNGVDGLVKPLWDAIDSVRSTTEDNQGSGVNLGYIAATCKHEDGGPASFAVGAGNPNVAIIARGYDLAEEVFDGESIKMVNHLTPEEREDKAVEHLSSMCMLAAKVECLVILDGSHKVPGMFSESSTDERRFLTVLGKFRQAAQEGRIKNVERIRGLLGEVSVTHGFTDRNMVLTPETEREFEQEVSEFEQFRVAA